MAGKSMNTEKNLDYDANLYCTFRKDTPEQIISKIMSFLKEKYDGPLDTAVDVGCGNGQSTISLAPHFKEVYGIDGIESQIQEAESSRKCDNITYRVGPAEILPFADSSVQLITAATSLHWFDMDRFFPEARRILSNNGVLAVYGYVSMKPDLKTPSNSKEIDELYEEFYLDLDSCFKPQAKIIFQKYRNVNFPFEEVVRLPDVRCSFKGRISDIVGYIKTYSSLKSLQEQDPAKAVRIINNFEKRLSEIAAKENITTDEITSLYRDYILILCRKVIQ